MNVVQLMVTIIIVTILVTVILGVVSYVAYWLRRSRRPLGVEEPEPDLRFFYRYVPERAGVAGNGRSKAYTEADKDDGNLSAGTLVSAHSRATSVAP